MSDLTVEGIKSLIRLTISLRTLRLDVEKAIHLELFHGNGNLYVKLFRGIRNQTLSIIQDAFVQALDFDLTEDMPDREKAAQALVLSGQLLSHLESLTGTNGIASLNSDIHIQTAPYVIVNASNSSDENQRKVMDTVRRYLSESDAE